MASTIFTRARLNEIFFTVGRFDDDAKRKFIHAPVDLLTLDGEMFLNTRSISTANGLSTVVPPVSQDSVIDEEWKSQRDIFCSELNPVVIGEHELGNWQERGADWTGLHKLGYI